jgi:hypothetical protein
MKNSYDLKVETYKNTVEHHTFASRKQAFVFINTTMFMQNKYRYARLLHEQTGEIWLEINWRGQDNYKRKGV